MFLAKFKKSEKKLIKEVARVQLAAIQGLLENTIEGEDIQLLALQQDLEESEMRRLLTIDLGVFKDLLLDPNQLFVLDEGNISSVKTLLTKFYGDEKYDRGRKGLWRKFRVMEYCVTSKNRLN